MRKSLLLGIISFSITLCAVSYTHLIEPIIQSVQIAIHSLIEVKAVVRPIPQRGCRLIGEELQRAGHDLSLIHI